MRFVKRLFLVVFALAAIAVIAVVLVPKKTLTTQALTQLEAQIDRKVEVNGDIRFQIFPNIGVSLQDVRIGNAEWSSETPLLDARKLSVGVELASLLRGDILVQSVEADTASVFLHQSSDGQRNWSFGGTSESTSTSNDAPDITINAVSVQNSTITYLEGDKDPLIISDVTASLRRLAGTAGSELTVSLTSNGEDVEAIAQVDDLAGLINGDSAQVSLDASAATATATYEGTLSTVPSGEGVVSVTIPDLDRVLAAFGQEPSGVDGSIQFDGTVLIANAEMLSIRNGVLASEPFSGEFDADIDLSADKPFVSAEIFANVLGQKSSGDSSASGSSSEWSDDPIDASILDQFNGDIKLTANTVYAGGLEFSPAAVQVTVDDARAVANLTNLGGYGGAITGQFVVNNRNGLSVGGALNAADVDLKPLLTATAGVSRFTGTGNAQLEFLGSGRSMNAIMNSLSGDGSLEIGSGTIAGIDLDNLFRGQPSGGTTIFDSLSATWSIASGVLSNEDLLMLLPNIESAGLGRIGLGGQNMDYTLVPSLKQRDGGKTIFPVRVEGPWSNLRIYPDLEAIIQQDLGLDTESLKEEAQDALEGEVRKQLGLEDDSGSGSGDEGSESQSIEDGLKKELGDLLGLD
ncbi:MAG: AsmA family protein [Pseudomonadota bacterium]